MSQADALLNTAAESTAEVGEAVVGKMILGFGALSLGPEGHISIDAYRRVSVPERLKRIAVQFDHNIETVEFDCPRYWDGCDMSEMRVYINYRRADKAIGSYRAYDIVTDENDSSVMHFKWTITKNVTMAKGQISFLVCIKKADEEGNEENHWNSELCQDMYVSEGLESGEPIVDQYPDVINQLEIRNQAMIEEITNQLLADRDAGLFNPTIEATKIAGGYVITITSGPNITEFEVLDGSTESIRNFMKDYVVIGDTEPAAGPAFWFDNTGLESGAVVLKYKDGDGVVTSLMPVTHIDNVEGMDEVVAHVESMDNPHGTTAAQVGAVANKGYTTTGTGAAYLATVDGIDALTAGVSFVMIPHVTSTNVTPTLNVNGLGEKGIRRQLSTMSGNAVGGAYAGWLTIGDPVRVTYNGDYWVADITKPSANDIDGEVPVTSGGTGKKTWTPNGLVYPSSETELAQVPAPTEDKSTLRKNIDGAPYWSGVNELALDIGAVRLKMGSYEGNDTAGNRDLGVVPKVLFIRSRVDHTTDVNIAQWDIMVQNDVAKGEVTYESNNGLGQKQYQTTATLGENLLVFGGSLPDNCPDPLQVILNRTGTTYDWFAFY